MRGQRPQVCWWPDDPSVTRRPAGQRAALLCTVSPRHQWLPELPPELAVSIAGVSVCQFTSIRNSGLLVLFFIVSSLAVYFLNSFGNHPLGCPQASSKVGNISELFSRKVSDCGQTVGDFRKYSLVLTNRCIEVSLRFWAVATYCIINPFRSFDILP